jgi:hypothetical protein
MSDELNRRQLISVGTALALSTFVPTVAAQQNTAGPRPPFPPADAGPLHERTMTNITNYLGQVPINSKDVLMKTVDFLLEQEGGHKIISSGDADLLRKLIDVIFSASGTMTQEIEKLYKIAVEKAGQVTIAIISIAKSSVNFAKKHRQEISIVASDVFGALSGAATLAAFGPVAAVFGAVASSVASSFTAYNATKK